MAPERPLPAPERPRRRGGPPVEIIRRDQGRGAVRILSQVQVFERSAAGGHGSSRWFRFRFGITHRYRRRRGHREWRFLSFLRLWWQLAIIPQEILRGLAGRQVLIPRGAKLVGVYDHHVAMGQARVMVAWHRLQYPDDSTLELGGMAGVDAAGYTWLPGPGR